MGWASAPKSFPRPVGAGGRDGRLLRQLLVILQKGKLRPEGIQE